MLETKTCEKSTLLFGTTSDKFLDDDDDHDYD